MWITIVRTVLVRCLRWACLAALLVANASWAQDHIVERAWLEDTSGQLTWSQVQQLPVRPYQGVLSRGYGRSAIWIRLRVDPLATTQTSREFDRLLLRIRPVYLDDIQVFDPMVPGGYAGVMGDLLPPQSQALEGLDFLLPIARGTEPRDIWLRVVSTSTRQVAVQVLNMEDLYRKLPPQQWLSAIYLGIVFMLMVWALIYWVFGQEVLIGLFALTQITALGFALVSLGYARVFWPEQWPASWLSLGATLFGILAVSSAILFHVVFFREFTSSPWVRWMHGLWLMLLPVKLLLVGLHSESLALQINMTEILFAPMIFLVSVLYAGGWNHPNPTQRPIMARTVVIGFYVMMCIISAVAALPGLAVLQGGELSLYVVQTHGLIVGLLILLMLLYRSHVRNKQQRGVALALERTQLQAQQERLIRTEQERLLAMLAHELKTPLATMHMRLDAHSPSTGAIKHAIRDMNAVIDRCLQTAQLGDQRMVARLEPVDLPGLVRETVAGCQYPERILIDQPATLVISTDRQLLFIVLNNLLENACKYAAPEALIQIRVSADSVEQGHAAGVRLEIANLPGRAGMPDPTQVFEKYYRSPHARRQAGTGLGLYLVRSLMQTLGGSIEYVPDEQFVRFVLHLMPIGAGE
jgi:two-component system, sensor histidine kinase LadS